MGFTGYFKLLRIKYHPTFALIALAMAYFAQAITPDLAFQVFSLYLVFNVLLYGGIYAINDIAGAKEDALHPMKQRQPVASGEIPPMNAALFALASIAAALLASVLFFDREITAFFLAFLFVNMLYTFAAKKLPYAELVIVSITHPMRFAMGVAAVKAQMPYFLIFALYSACFGIAALIKEAEIKSVGNNVRSTLKHYTEAKILAMKLAALAAMLAFFALDMGNYLILYATLFPVYIFLSFSPYMPKPLRELVFQKAWLGIWKR